VLVFENVTLVSRLWRLQRPLIAAVTLSLVSMVMWTVPLLLNRVANQLSELEILEPQRQQQMVELERG
jgi:hypothetical protein